MKLITELFACSFFLCRLTQQHEEEIRSLLQSNHDLRIEVVKAEMSLEDKTEELDEENLKVAKLLGRLRDAKRGIKKIYAEDDESYIEIIIP